MRAAFGKFLRLAAAVALSGAFPFSTAFCDGIGDYVNSARAKTLESAFFSDANRAGARGAAFFAVLDGECLAGRVSDSFAKKSLPLGDASAAVLSLVAENMQSSGAVSLSADVSGFFSAFSASGGKVAGANITNLLNQTAGIGYLAEKIPADAAPDEFFSMLSQTGFSAPDTVFYRSRASVAAAGYALAYAFEPTSKNLKKSFVRCCGKYFFEPLGIKNPKYINFEKSVFPSIGFALSPDGVVRWLECETSKTPPILDSETVSSRRLRRAQCGESAGGWRRFAGADGAFECSGGAGKIACKILVFESGGGSFAVAMFAGVDSVETAKKLFGRTENSIAEMLKEKIK
mgnify:CR=1 FL=1